MIHSMIIHHHSWFYDIHVRKLTWRSYRSLQGALGSDSAPDIWSADSASSKDSAAVSHLAEFKEQATDSRTSCSSSQGRTETMAKHLAPPTIHCSGATLLCWTARLRRVHRLGVAPSIVDRHYKRWFHTTQKWCLAFEFISNFCLVNFVISFHK